MNMHTEYEGKKSIKDYEDNSWYVLRLTPNKKGLVLANVRDSMGGGSISWTVRRLHSFPVATLKEVEVWNQLNQKMQDELTSYESNHTQNLQQRMNHARGKRRERFVGVPREAVCCKCGKKQPLSPANIIKRADKAGRSIENWIKEFQCQNCNGTKGRKANPKYAHLPKELVCACGNKVKTNSTAIISAAERRKITPEEYVKQYKCQVCCPSKGRHKRISKKGKGKNKA